MHANAASISARTVADLPAGQSVQAWTLIGGGGLTLEALTYGGIVTRLLVPDRLGKIDDTLMDLIIPGWAISFFAPDRHFIKRHNMRSAHFSDTPGNVL